MAAAAIVSVFGMTRLVFAPASGKLINLLGERPMYLAGLFIVALSTLATTFAQGYWELVVYRGLGGIGSTLFTVSATAMIVKMAPGYMRGRAASAYGGAFLIGNIAGPVVGGILGHIDIRLPFTYTQFHSSWRLSWCGGCSRHGSSTTQPPTLPPRKRGI
ncbi:MAG: MFS transporter [Lawsonella clevelandensis]